MSSRFLAIVRSCSLLAIAPLSAMLVACSNGAVGSACQSSDECDAGLVCTFAGGASSGVCIHPDDDPGALPKPTYNGALQLTVNRDVDILFVIDNSGSMGEAQANLAASFPVFIDALEAKGVDANYRIGVTTSDNGNPWCPAGVTTPEGGKLVLSSCKDRLADFLFGDQVDVQDLACNDLCQLDATALAISPTTTDTDDVPSPRPWLESIEGTKNIPATTSMADAFACFGPQGVNGCGFESQLESMYLALTRAQTNTEASYGFMRSSAILAVVIVSDEADCSYNRDWAEIFEADGNKAFWSDPSAAFPTSALCWNAGVECAGDPSGYSSCDPVNKDVNGSSGVSDADAVLHPVSRYTGLIAGIEADKQALNAQQEVIVALIGGVRNTGEVFYADDLDDPAFQDTFGIGPGCTAAGDVSAIPPVRMRDMTEAFTPGNMFSICEGDLSPALEAIADRIKDQIQPACYSQCVADSDPATPGLQPECTVEENPPGNGKDDTISLEECLRDQNGDYVIDPNTDDYAMPAADINVCYAALTDATMSTASTADDMSIACAEVNFNLEFALVRRPGFPAAGGTSVSAVCTLAESYEDTCPGIGGG